ncbi:MAG: DoxX family protein, partial [bacterium]
IAKAIPMQMPILALARLVEPFGNFSPMGVLWYSVGAAPAYEVITGCAELTAGSLLFWPRTATLGALLALMDMAMVFILNMTYDVPVKLFSFHLVVLSIVIIAPNAKRLFELFVLHRSTAIRDEPTFGRVPATNRRAVVAQLVFAAYVLSVNVYQGVDGWTQFGAGASKSPLFGIWDITDMSIDGQARPALLSDRDRFHRLIFQQPAFATIQQMDDSFKRYAAVIDTVKHTLVLTATDSTKAKASLTYRRVTPQQLVIDGTMGGRIMHLDATVRELNSFLLKSRGFHWVQEQPFNR